MDKHKFTFNAKQYNSSTIVRLHENSRKVRASKRYKSQYFVVDVIYKGVFSQTFFVKYKRAKAWTLLLTTDMTMGFNKTMGIYQIRTPYRCCSKNVNSILA